MVCININKKQKSLNFFIVVVFLQLEWIDSDIIALRLAELFTLSEFFALISYDFLFYFAFAFVLFHLHWHLSSLFYFFLLLGGGCYFVFLHEFGENGVQYGFILFGLNIILSGEVVSFGLSFRIRFWIENSQWIVHFVERDHLLNEFEGLLSLFAFGKFLHFHILGVERRYLWLEKWDTFLLEDYWESIVLKTEDLIWALMLLRYPFFSRFCMTRFLSSLSSYISFFKLIT